MNAQLALPLARATDRRVKPVSIRLLSKVEKPDGEAGCWLWTGATDRHGYGQITRGRRGEGKTGAHRAAYEAFVGPIPDGLDLDHLCRTPLCVNPAHLEPVTRAENTRRGQWPDVIAVVLAKRRARTQCGYGHDYTPENTYVRPNGTRCCRTCARVLNRKSRARLKSS